MVACVYWNALLCFIVFCVGLVCFVCVFVLRDRLVVCLFGFGLCCFELFRAACVSVKRDCVCVYVGIVLFVWLVCLRACLLVCAGLC